MNEFCRIQQIENGYLVHFHEMAERREPSSQQGAVPVVRGVSADPRDIRDDIKNRVERELGALPPSVQSRTIFCRSFEEIMEAVKRAMTAWQKVLESRAGGPGFGVGEYLTTL